MNTELKTKLIIKLIEGTNNKYLDWSTDMVAGGVIKYKCSTPEFDIVLCTALSTAIPDVILSKGNLLIQIFSSQDHTPYHNELRTLVLQLISAIKLYINNCCDWNTIVENYLKYKRGIGNENN